MDPIDSYAKDKSLKSTESKLYMRNVGDVCIIGEVLCGGGRRFMRCYSHNDSKRKGSKCQPPMRGTVSRFESIVLYQGLYYIGFKIARSFRACLALFLTMGPFKEAHMCPTCLEIASSMVFIQIYYHILDEMKLILGYGSHGVPSPNMEAKSQLFSLKKTLNMAEYY